MSNQFDLTSELASETPLRRRKQHERETSLVALNMGGKKEGVTENVYNESLLRIPQQDHLEIKIEAAKSGSNRNAYIQAMWHVVKRHPEILAEVGEEAGATYLAREEERQQKRKRSMG